MYGVSMKVHLSHTGEAAPAAATKRAAHSATTPRTSFASLHATAVAASTAKTTTPGTDVSQEAKPIKLRTGEAMSPVAGHAYAEITSGKRDGMYVNTTNNKRRGQAFVLVHKNGRDYHIYGTGKDRVVVALKARKTAAPAAAQPAPASTPTVSATGSTGGTKAA
jgi:hypothetical protein